MERRESSRGSLVAWMAVIGVFLLAYIAYASQPNPNGGETLLSAQIHAAELKFGFLSPKQKETQLDKALNEAI